MPGLAIRVNNKNSEISCSEILNNFRSVYKVPNVSYSEESLVHKNYIFYNCFPNVIKESKLLEKNELIISFEGDFYNDEELSLKLSVKNNSKIELIYELFVKYGDGFADFINGEFVIVIYNKNNNEVIITNDRFARKGFFYSSYSDCILLGSEKKVIVSNNDKSFELDELGMYEVFMLIHNIRERTFIKNIFSLPPCSILKWSNGELSLKKYWDWCYDNSGKSPNNKEIIKQIYEKLKMGEERRIKENSKMLLWLSGGYDSRTIGAMIPKKERKNISAKMIGNKISNEVDISKRAAKALNYKFEWLDSENISFNFIAAFGAWRTEFTVSALGHPMSYFHKNMLNAGRYVLSGLPGFGTLNGEFIRFWVILASLYNNMKFSHKIFLNYVGNSRSKNIIFTDKFWNRNYPKLENEFIKSLNEKNINNKLDRYDVWQVTERQPQFSNMTDKVDTDLFEYITPFCDIELLNVFRKIKPLRRIGKIYTTNMLYQYFPEIRSIEYDMGRGKVKKNHFFLYYIIKLLKIKLLSQNSQLYGISQKL